MKCAVFINCNQKYVGLSIISLKCFVNKNPNYDMFIIGTKFDNDTKDFAKRYNVCIKEINLYKDFINLDKRPYGKEYPIECFYHFYAYKIFTNYDYIVSIEPDIYTNKKMDIDLNNVKYICGTYYGTISHNVHISKDAPKLKHILGNPTLNQPKILSGFRIYNVKNLPEIKFYEKIVYYYKLSLRAKVPRCGDDTLMVLYQAFNPSHFHLVEPNYNIWYGTHYELNNVKNIYHYHFINDSKYWKPQHNTNLCKKNHVLKYFNNKYIEFIYNNFNPTYIKKYTPRIYVDISNVVIDFYYFNGTNNFGDLITPYFLKKFCDKKDYRFNFDNNSNKPKVLSCGSIMRLCNNNTIVYGSGIRDIDQNIEKGTIQFVRGPLTRNNIIKKGYYCPPLYGDPGLLLPLYYNPNIPKKYKLGIIPHYVHYQKIKKIYNNEPNIIIINLINDNVEFVIRQILSCNCVISSSLHGLIVSDAYNVPNKWIYFDNNIKGDNTKFYDYFQSVHRQDQEYINNTSFEKLNIDNIISQISPVNINYNIHELKNLMFFNKNGIKNYTKYLIKKKMLYHGIK